MIFAAGLGTRMGDMVKDRPKPLISVGNTTLLDHAMSFLSDDMHDPKVANIHYKGEMLRNHLQATNVLISDETAQLMETGGGLKKALPLLNADCVLTTNTDAVWQGPNPAKALLDAWKPEVMTALLLLVPLNNAQGHPGNGDFLIDEDGRLTRGRGPVYTGMQIIKTAGLSQMPDDPFSMNLYWDAISKEGGLYGTLFDGKWCDVGRPSSIPLAEKLLANDV